jgi:hypothetical protein
MSEAPNDIHMWNLVCMQLIEAMLGSISCNFRRVTLGHSGTHWHMEFVLAAESEADREAVSDIAVDFEALQDGPIDLVVDVHVTTALLEQPSWPTRILFKRREEWDEPLGD